MILRLRYILLIISLMKIRFNLSYCLIVIFFLIIGCHSDDIRELSIPILQTTKITDITETTASSGGLVLSDGGTSIINKGIITYMIDMSMTRK